MQDMETVKEIDFAELEKSRSFRMFSQAVKSDKTFYSYRYALREFLKYSTNIHLNVMFSDRDISLTEHR